MWGRIKRLFCRAPREQPAGPHHGDPPERRQHRRRRHRRNQRPKAANGLAPLRVTVSDAASPAISPLSEGRASLAFSESIYEDAMEEFGSEGGRGSIDGASLSSPGSGAYSGRSGDDAAAQQPGSLVDRIALWWEGRKATNHTTAAEEEETPRGGGGAAGGGGFAPHTNGSPQLAAEDVLEPSPDSTKVGCLPIFGRSESGLASKKYLRLSRPPAGSSFREPAAAPEGAPASASAVERLLSTLSPTAPLLRLLSGGSSKRRRKTFEEGAGAIAAWAEADGPTFSVRSLHYMRTKLKVPSEPCMYRLVGVDVYSFDFKLYHIAQHVSLPAPPALGPGAAAAPPDQRLPPLLIINLQLPWYPATLFGPNDGHGHSLVYYFALPEGWEPSQMSNQAALGLVQRFVHNRREFDGTPTRERFKLIPRIVNADEWAVQGPLTGYEHRLLMNYNDKPFLTRPQHRFYTGPNYLEIDLDVHQYAFIARKGFNGFIRRLNPVVFENAFVIQGNRPEELPEQVLAAARVYRCDFDKAKPFPARSLESLGNGTGPSHDGDAAR